MKWILSLMIFISAASFGQAPTNDSTKYIWFKYQYGLRQPRIAADSFAQMPYGDTTGRRGFRPGAIMMHTDKKFYKWDSTNWVGIGAATQLTDSSFKVGGDTITIRGTGGEALNNLADSTGSKIQVIGDSTFVLNTGVGGIYDSTVYAYPGDTLQRKLELVPAYGRLMIMPGLHVLPLDTLNSIMYVDRSNLTIEFAPGSHVKVKDSSNAIIDSVEINRNYGNIAGLDDISAQTTIHPPVVNQSIQIQITSTGTPDQFTVTGASSGNGAYAITGAFQAIGTTGIEVKFNATTGHTLNDLWWLVTSSTPASVLRVGEGFHADTIRNINIIGHGVLDGNVENQDTVNVKAHESNYTVGVFGRVHNITIKDISIINGERSIMASGRHSGTFNQNGNTTGGESYDVSDLRIFNVNSYNNTAGFLFGHPAYRGYTKNVFMSGCNVINNTSLATVEPNHRCDSFIIVKNYIENKSLGSSLHLWRAPSNGKIFNNIIRGTTADNAPTGWYRSFGLNNWADYDNNLFSLSQQNAIGSSNNASRIGLGTTTPTTKLQVVGPHVSGQGLVNIKGNSTVGFVVLNTTTAPGTTGFSLQSAGGAVGSVQGVGSDTTLRIFNDRFPGAPFITGYNNGNVNIGIPNGKQEVKLQIRDSVNAPTNAIRALLRLQYKWTGTTPSPVTGLGPAIDIDATNAVSNSAPKNIAKFEFPFTDGTNGSEDADIVFKNIRAGTVTESFRITSTGAAKFNNAFTFPTADGTNGQVLQTDGSGNVSWQNTSSGITSINSQTGPAITIQGGTGTSVSNSTNTVTVEVVPSSSALPHTLDTVYTTQGNTGTSETDLYSYTVPANKLGVDGRTVNFEADGEFNDNTITAQLKLYFGGNVTLNTGAVNVSTALTAWRLKGYIIRTSSTTAHVTYELHAPGLATPVFVGYNNLTSLDFTVGNIIKISAQAAGGGASDSDITAHSWQITYKPIPL